MKEYIEVWNSSFKFEESLSRKSYWSFECVNFLCLVIIFRMMIVFEIDHLFQIFKLLFILSSFSAGIRRMNDIKKPWFYLFIPFYNFILLLEKSVDEHDIESLTPRINRYAFLELLFYSIMIGVINLLLPAFVYKDNEISMSFFLIISVYTGGMTFLSFIIFPLAAVFLKSKLTNYSLFIYFLLFLFFSVVIQFVFLQPDEYR
jgi:uncharacterized membrane protein YhaH (DUF805 family)